MASSPISDARVLEARGPDHAKRLIELLGGEGYTAEVLD